MFARFSRTTGFDMKRILAPAAIACFITLLACSGPREIKAEREWTEAVCVDFNDCALVRIGDVCDLLCPNTAIHADFFADYFARYEDAAAQCFPPAPQVVGDGSNPCPESADCVDGRCVLVVGD